MENINWKLFFTIFFLLLVLDAIYIMLFGNYFNDLFKKTQGGRKLTIKYSGFIAAYLLMASIIYYFGIIKKFTLKDIFLLGISIYGVYELTNYATLIDWTLRMVFMDTLWGGILFVTTLFIMKKLKYIS